MTKNLMVLPLLCALVILIGCSKNRASTQHPQGRVGPLSGTAPNQMFRQIAITDLSGTPIAGATVLIGDKAGVPFKNNILTTDQLGSFKTPAEWTTPQPVTITANGFVRTTFINQLPTQKTFEVRAQVSQTKPELDGITDGFGKLKNDGFVDVGTVIPALTRIDLANFQASTLLSPETDTIKVFGKELTLPSNITLPEQSETIFPLTVKLNKPTYRMFFDRPASYKIVSAHVKFPLKKVIGEVQSGKNGIDLVNDFIFLEAGVTSNTITNEKQNADLMVNQFKFDSQVSVTAPSLTQTQSVLAVPLVQDGTDLYPTDIKTLTSSNTKQLTYRPAASGFVLAVLRDDNLGNSGAANDFMSVELHSATDASSLNFLSLLNAPVFENNVISVNPPAQLPGLQSVATLATLSSVAVKNLGKGSYEIKNPEWDIYVPGWVNQISLPSSVLDLPAGRLRWEITFMAAPQSSTALTIGPKLMNSVTHLTRSAVDL